MNPIDSAWRDFADAVLPETPAVNQEDEMRMTYVVGWFTALGTLADLVPAVRSDPQWRRLFDHAERAMHREHERLEIRYQAEHGSPQS